MTCLEYQPPHVHAVSTCETTENFSSDSLTEKIINNLILCKHIICEI